MQSIVDGECSHETRALLLREIGTEPAAWRVLALALLEDREWSKELLVDWKHRNDTAHDLSVPEPALNESQTKSEGMQPIISIVGIPHSNPQGVEKGFSWLTTLAASFLLGLGVFGGSFLPKIIGLNPPQAPTIADQRSSEPDANERLSPANYPYETDMKMLVSGPNEEKSEIPVYDMREAGHDLFVAREMYEIAKINQRLRRDGYELDVRPEYYTGKLNDGRSIVVPVKHVGLKPYGF